MRSLFEHRPQKPQKMVYGKRKTILVGKIKIQYKFAEQSKGPFKLSSKKSLTSMLDN